MDSDDRALCTVARVKSINPIEGADKIVVAQVNGWQCVISKEENVREGDLALYYSIDSIPDLEDPNCALVKKRGGRIKTMKLRGIISQGLLAPLSWMESRGYDISELNEGDDVTEQMGVTKFVHEDEADQYFHSDHSGKGSNEDVSHEDENNQYFRSDYNPYKSNKEVIRVDFPDHTPKTKEHRLQDNPKFLDYIAERNIIITRKEDGSSATYSYNAGTFQVSGRNFNWLAATPVCKNYYLIAHKYNIEDKMKSLNRNLSIQGELLGPKINANRLRLDEVQFRVYNIWDIDDTRYLHWCEVEDLCTQLELPTVPVVFRGPASELELTVPAFLRIAEEQKYAKNVLGEGIVVKTDDGTRRLSFKVISNKYLLKHNL